MPPKRPKNPNAPVYTLNSNVLMHEISKRIKTKNAARLSIALGSRKVPGLSKAVKALNTQRKEDAVRIAKAQIHGIARRVVTVMRGIRMLVDKKRPKEYTSRTMAQNIKNNAWTARYGPNFTITTKHQQQHFSKTLEDRAFGGLKIRVAYRGEVEVPRLQNMYRADASWLVSIQWKSDIGFQKGAGTQFWINANTQRIKSDPDPRDYAGFWAINRKATHSTPLEKQCRVIVKAIASAIFKDIVTQWNALPKTKPDQK